MNYYFNITKEKNTQSEGKTLRLIFLKLVFALGAYARPHLESHLSAQSFCCILLKKIKSQEGRAEIISTDP